MCKLFEFLGADQSYVAPVLGDDSSLHSAILIGSGTPRDGRTETFFMARSSHGICAHAKYHAKNYGRDFLVRASDLLTAQYNCY